MKYLLMCLLLCSCSTLSNAGKAVCDAQHDVSKTIEEVGSFLGGPGKVGAGVTNAVLRFSCKIFDAIVSSPKNTVEDVSNTFSSSGVQDGEESK